MLPSTDQARMMPALRRAGAWWDYVDEIAQHRAGLLLRRFPRPADSILSTVIG
jgi:hypothetical protein